MSRSTGGAAADRSSGVFATWQSALHVDVVRLFGRARGIDIRAYEEQSADEIAQSLLPEVSKLISQAVGVADRVMNEFQDRLTQDTSASDGSRTGAFEGERTTGEFYIGVDALMDNEADGVASAVGDIAFLTLLDLRNKDARLSRLSAAHDRWELIDECGSALRHISKGFAAMEHAIADGAGLKPVIPWETELTKSLATRRAYSRLRRVARELGEPGAEGLVPALRALGTQFAVLVGRNVYRDLRVADRRELRALQARLIDWLRAAAVESADRADGVRLWQDIASFCGLLAQVSRRQELVQHDELLLRRLVARGGPYSTDELRPLAGLDDELDDLVAATPRDGSNVRCEDTLPRMEASFRRTKSEPGSARFD